MSSLGRLIQLFQEPGVGGSRSELGYPAPESEAFTAPGGLGRKTYAECPLGPVLVFLELIDQAFDQIFTHSEHPPLADHGRLDVL